MTRRKRTAIGWAGVGALLAALVLLVAAPAALADGGWVYTGSFGSQGSGDGQFGGDVVGRIAYDGHGTLYVADYSGERIEKWSTSGAYLSAWGTLGSGDGQFTSPFGVAYGPNGDLFVTEEGGSRVQELSDAGVWKATVSGFASPYGVAIDSDGAIWVADVTTVKKFDASGNLLFQVDPTPSGDSFGNAMGIAVDSAGEAYVADLSNNRIVVFSKFGDYMRQWSYTDPWTVTVDPAGHVFVGGWADGITEFNRAGGTIATFGQGNFTNNQGAVYGIAVDGKGHLWASDGWGSRVEEYTWDEPAITTSADGDWHSQDTVVTFSATDAVSGVKELDYSTDGGTTWHQDDAVAVAAPADHSNDGVHAIQVRATSNDGNTKTVTFRVKIDTKAPVVAANGPFDEWMSGPQTFWFSATDVGAGVSGIDYSLDGGPAQPVGNDGSVTVTGEGSHVISYWADDNCVDTANESVQQDASVYIDSTPPVATALSNVTVIRGKKATFRFGVNDALSDSCWVEIAIIKKGKVVKRIEVGGRATSATAQKTIWTCKLARGTYTWKVSAFDMAGNYGVSGAKKLTVK